MKGVKLAIRTGLLLLIVAPVLIATAGEDARCEGLSGAAFGLCTAAVNVGCDNEETRKTGCTKIEEKFEQITGEAPPWTVPSCIDNTECSETEFCKKASGDCDGNGVCTSKPTACIAAALPVLTCGGTTAGNYCEAYQAGKNILCYTEPFYSEDHDEPVCGGSIL